MSHISVRHAHMHHAKVGDAETKVHTLGHVKNHASLCNPFNQLFVGATLVCSMLDMYLWTARDAYAIVHMRVHCA